MGDLILTEQEERAQGTYTPTSNDEQNPTFKFFMFVEILRIVLSILCIIIGVILIVKDSHIAINLGSITYKSGSITDIEINLGTLLCAVGLFFSYLSAKFFKIGD